jgi:hypothetical protein
MGFRPFSMCALALLFATPLFGAEQAPDAKTLQEALTAKVPSTWQIHVTQRGGTLLGFVTPPIQEAFDLWYEPQRLQQKLQSLCPAASDQVWSRVSSTADLVLQPTVGGKTADGMQVNCPRGSKPPA